MLKKSLSQYKGLLCKKSISQKFSQKWATQMTQKILQLQNNDGQQYISKNSIEQLIHKIDRNHIEIIDKFSNYKENGFNLLEFVRFFLNILSHDEIQNLYLTIGLIDLFKAISTYAGVQRVSFSHITNFLCQKILQKQQSKNQIQAKNIPQITYVKPNYQLKDFIRNPPIIYGSNDDTLYKLSYNSITTDKSKHYRAVNTSQFSYDLKMIFTLDALSEYIAVYDFNCSQINKVYPSFSKIKKDVVVLGFAFSQRQFRLGAVLKNFSVVFWDCRPNNTFDYEKSWSTTSYCQHLQSSIFHLEYFNNWITSDKTGTLYFWDLLNSKPQRQFKCKFYSAVNIICQISALNIIAVVQQSKQKTPDQNMQGSCVNFQQKKNIIYQCNIVLYNYFSGQVLNEISCSDDRVPHTIQYSEQYQILFSAGLQKKIKLWQINPLYMDSSLKGQLIGHQNLITSFTTIRKTSLLVSCDDKGKIKLWDFKNFACIQTIDFSDKAMITNLLDMVEIGKIGILGSRIHYVDFQDKLQIIKKIKNRQKISIEWIDHDQSRNQIYLFTQKDLRVLDMNKGSIKYIYGCFNSQDQDYTCFRYFSCIQKFALGNDKGQTSIYDIGTGSFLYSLKTLHEGSVIGVQYDQLNKLFITLGSDSSIFIHKQCSRQIVRQIKGNFMGRQISCFQLSVFHSLFAVSTHEKQFSRSIFIWNYQFGKLSGQILIKQGYQINSFQFINGYNILVIATSEGNIHLVKITQLTGSQIKLQQLRCLQLQKSVLSISCDLILKGSSKTQLQQCVIIVSFNDNTFQEIDLTNLLKNLETVPHCKLKTNYNPYRESKQTFSMEYMKKKHEKLELKGINKKENNTKQNHEFHKLSTLRSIRKFQTQIKIEVEDEIKLQQQQNLYQSPVKISFQDSTDERIIQRSVKLLQQQYPKKTLTSVTSKAILQTSSSQKQKYGDLIPTGFTQINVIKIMNYQKRFIIIVGNNRRIKIYNKQFKLVCDFNVNYPLPYLWNFKPKLQKKIKDKIYFAIKVLNSILVKYESDISVGEAKNYKLKILFEKLNIQSEEKFIRNSLSSNNYQKQNDQNTNILLLTQPDIKQAQKPKRKKKRSQQQKIPLIHEQFSKNDLNFHLIKQYNFHQVAGPTLKQLDHIKKIQLLQKEWRQKQKQQQEDCDKILKNIRTKVRKNQEKQQLISFLSPNNKSKEIKESSYVLNIRKKIDNMRLIQTKDEQDKQKQIAMSLFNTSKLMNISHNIVVNQKNLHKDTLRQKQDQHLLQVCLRRHTKSNNTIKRLKTTQSFQDYFQSRQPRTLFLKKRVNTQEIDQTNSTKKYISASKQNKQYLLDKNSSNNNFDFFKQMFKKENKNLQDKNNKLIKKSHTSGSKFRRILTQMNQKVRQKKIQKIKF